MMYYVIQSDIGGSLPPPCPEPRGPDPDPRTRTEGSLPSWVVNMAMAGQFKDFRNALSAHCAQMAERAALAPV